ncbi:MAG: hypothetical protein AB9897_04435 [Anaerolineaceae bacterium]
MSREYWPQWAQKLQHHPLKGFLLTFLEGSGSLKLILGQFMLAGMVFVNPTASDRWLAVAEILEDDSESRAFAALLQEENIH